MNNKQFLEIFNDIDEEIIQQANEDVNAWLKDRNGIVVRSDERRGFLRKTIITSAACAAVVLSGVFIINNFIPAKPLENSNDSPADTDSLYHFADPEDRESKAEDDGWEIQHIKENYPVYHSAEELVSDADVVFVGTVRNYGTATLDHIDLLSQPLNEQDISDRVDVIDVYLHGEVEVITPYKGTISEAETIKFGFTTKEIEEIKELYSVEEICEQSATGTREIMIETASGKIFMVVCDVPEIKIGETYLFCLKADGNAYNFTVNPYQSVINISEPFAKDKYGYLSAEDIISYFGNDAVNTGAVYKVVDPIDDSVRRELDFSDTKITIYNIREHYEYDPTIDGSVVSLGYLKEFFGNYGLPFDEEYKDNLERVTFNAVYRCKVSEGAKAYSPVDGKVVAINDDFQYHGGLGNGVAIEFEDKVFILAHLAEVNVKVGDTVTAGQTVGICGTTGAVDGTVLSIYTMKKIAD